MSRADTFRQIGNTSDSSRRRACMVQASINTLPGCSLAGARSTSVEVRLVRCDLLRVTPGAAFVCVGFFSVGLGVVLLRIHREDIGETHVYKGFFATRSAGMGVMMFGLVLLLLGLVAWRSAPDASASAPRLPEVSDQTQAPTPSPPPAMKTARPQSQECCATNCASGAPCVPCNVDELPWGARVSGVGYEAKGRATIDLADSNEWADVQICVTDSATEQGGCVPLTQAVRHGGAAVLDLPSQSSTGLRDNGLHIIVKGTKDGEVQTLTDFTRHLQVNPKSVCGGYRLGPKTGGYFVSLFLVDARPE